MDGDGEGEEEWMIKESVSIKRGRGITYVNGEGEDERTWVSKNGC